MNKLDKDNKEKKNKRKKNRKVNIEIHNMVRDNIQHCMISDDTKKKEQSLA